MLRMSLDLQDAASCGLLTSLIEQSLYLVCISTVTRLVSSWPQGWIVRLSSTVLALQAVVKPQRTILKYFIRYSLVVQTDEG